MRRTISELEGCTAYHERLSQNMNRRIFIRPSEEEMNFQLAYWIFR